MSSRTLIAHLTSDDGFDFIYIAVKINESCIELIKRTKKILEENSDVISSAAINGDILAKNTTVSEIYASNIRKDDLDENFCKVVDYPISQGRYVEVVLAMNLSGEIFITALDNDQNSFGEYSGVSINYEDIVL